MARQVLPVIGAAIGGYFGGAQGAQWGWAIGSVVGNAVDPMIIKGPSIGDIAQQTSQEGVPRPIVFALSPPIAGNIIVSGPPRIVRRRTTQGKGGPKTESESVYRTYAIGVCEGPITRFVRVWRNNVLVYDDSDTPIVGDAENAAFLNTARFFTGSWNQFPSADIESLGIYPIGFAPAHRGTAYMVMASEDLTDLRGAIPQYVFQIERCEGYFLTSRPYPIEVIEALESSGIPKDSNSSMTTEAIEISGVLLSGTVTTPLHTYQVPTEALDIEGSLESGELRTVLHTYDDAAPEAIDVSGELLSGEIHVALITYDDGTPEALDIDGTLLSGTLT